jgi:hypothetical protein
MTLRGRSSLLVTRAYLERLPRPVKTRCYPLPVSRRVAEVHLLTQRNRSQHTAVCGDRSVGRLRRHLASIVSMGRWGRERGPSLTVNVNASVFGSRGRGAIAWLTRAWTRPSGRPERAGYRTARSATALTPSMRRRHGGCANSGIRALKLTRGMNSGCADSCMSSSLGNAAGLLRLRLRSPTLHLSENRS